jgi:hypothetical protein
VLRRLRALSEEECQARLYGGGDDFVRRVELARRPADLAGRPVRNDPPRPFEPRRDEGDAEAA